MYTIKTLNAISPVGLAKLNKNLFDVAVDADAPDGILVRSADLLNTTFNDNLLAIARAAVSDPPVLILDDPFSALDKPTEAEIFRELRELAKDSIVLLISHRLYLFPQLDQVLWMENGTVTAGTHEELLQKVPAYSALAADQEGGQNHA